MNQHQQKQKEVITTIEKQIQSNSINFSTVAPVANYDNDTRIGLTSVHFPSHILIAKIQETLIKPLSKIEPSYYYYGPDSLHMTIKNIRVINDPPQFTKEDIKKAKNIFSEIIPKHKKFNVYFYRLLLFPNNLALVGTTDKELDNLILDLDKNLKKEEVPDDKQYSNSHYFFSNMTLARFSQASDAFKNKVKELSRRLSFESYTVDSIALLTCNAVFKKRYIIKTINLY